MFTLILESQDRSTDCFHFQELDFFKDFDRPELPYLWPCESDRWLFILTEFDLTEFQVGSLELLLHRFYDDLHEWLLPLSIDEFLDYQSNGGRESIVSSNPFELSPYQ